MQAERQLGISTYSQMVLFDCGGAGQLPHAISYPFCHLSNSHQQRPGWWSVLGVYQASTGQVKHCYVLAASCRLFASLIPKKNDFCFCSGLGSSIYLQGFPLSARTRDVTQPNLSGKVCSPGIFFPRHLTWRKRKSNQELLFHGCSHLKPFFLAATFFLASWVDAGCQIHIFIVLQLRCR